MGFKEWEKIQSKIKAINFWSLPTEIDYRGFDGAEWILEGATKDDYHVMTRWSPEDDSECRKCYLYLLSLSGMKISDNVN